jgi:hypothetical protein
MGRGARQLHTSAAGRTPAGLPEDEDDGEKKRYSVSVPLGMWEARPGPRSPSAPHSVARS